MRDIVSVDKGMMATIKINAGQEYPFKVMRIAKEWVDLIIRAVRDAQTASTYTSPQPAYLPPQPAPAAPRSNFCTECGSPLTPTDKFCRNCGKML